MKMTKKFQQIKRSTNLSEEVATRIKESILNARYGPGNALPSEIRLADQFGVSRVVIREALKELKSKGLIEIRRGPKGGPYVTDLGMLNFGEQFSDMIRLRMMTVEQLFQVRLLIEPEVLRLVLRKISDDEIQTLQDLVVKTKTEPDPATRKNLNMEFHRQLGHLCGNPFYSLFIESFMDFIDRFINVLNPGTYDLHDDISHGEITKALAARDETKALTLMQSHLLDTKEKMILQEKDYLRRSMLVNDQL
jgi:DNA-binding FadR family transcriptional regulator